MAKRQSKTVVRRKAEEHFNRRLGSTVRAATKVKAIVRRECIHAGIEPTTENMSAIGEVLSRYDVKAFEPEPPDEDDDDDDDDDPKPGREPEPAPEDDDGDSKPRRETTLGPPLP
jgi:hypothetical protein